MLSAYVGKARELYCSTTGLSDSYIRTATLAALRIATSNCRIPVNEVKGKSLFPNIIDYYRSLLSQFLHKRFSKF